MDVTVTVTVMLRGSSAFRGKRVMSDLPRAMAPIFALGRVAAKAAGSGADGRANNDAEDGLTTLRRSEICKQPIIWAQELLRSSP